MELKKTFVFGALLAGATLAWAAPAQEGAFQRTLKVSGAVELTVGTGAGSVKVSKGSGSEVHVSARIRASDGWGLWRADPAETIREIEQNPPIRQDGNRIVIGSKIRKWENVSISYEITTPEDTRVDASSGSGSVDAYELHGPAELSTGSGNVSADRIGSDVRASTGSGTIKLSQTGSVRATTGSGRIDVTDVKGDVEANTGSGGVSVARATGRVRAHAASGNVRVERAVADLDVQSASGNLEVDGAPNSAHWELSTASGTVRVLLPHDSGFQVDAHAGSGTVSTTHPVTVSGTMRRGELRGTAGNGANHLHIRSSSGSIHID